MRITDRFRGIYRIYLKWINKQNRKMSTCNRLDYRITRILTDYAQKLPRHWCVTPYLYDNHNIIHIQNIVLWEWQYSTKYSPPSHCMWDIFRIILSIPHNIVMDLNNVMTKYQPIVENRPGSLMWRRRLDLFLPNLYSLWSIWMGSEGRKWDKPTLEDLQV